MTDKDFFEMIGNEAREKFDKPRRDKKEGKNVFCDCFGDIGYEEALKNRHPFNNNQLKELDLLEGAHNNINERLKFDRNKGYCHTDKFFLAWQTNGEPVIVQKNIKDIGQGNGVCEIHFADHPENFPTPEDVQEEWPEELLVGEPTSPVMNA